MVLYSVIHAIQEFICNNIHIKLLKNSSRNNILFLMRRQTYDSPYTIPEARILDYLDHNIFKT